MTSIDLYWKNIFWHTKISELSVQRLYFRTILGQVHSCHTEGFQSDIQQQWKESIRTTLKCHVELDCHTGSYSHFNGSKCIFKSCSLFLPPPSCPLPPFLAQFFLADCVGIFPKSSLVCAMSLLSALWLSNFHLNMAVICITHVTVIFFFLKHH